MKVGVLQFFSWPERRVPLETVFARALERIEIMDRAGYDAVWLAEHHFSSFSVCPSVHMMGTIAAARTKRLRIGTGVSLAPFYHPLRLAEEVALLDVLSGGRVNWGAGRGFARVEFEHFGVPPEESTSRFHEAVEIVLRAWTEERLSFAGKHFRFDGVEVLPKPMQQPHPPVWMAATSESSIDWAAARGFSILMDPHSAHRDLGRKRRFYAERLAAAGFSIDGPRPADRAAAGARRQRGEAEEVARRGAEWIVNSYFGAQHHPVGVTDPAAPGADPVQRYLDGVILHGTPEVGARRHPAAARGDRPRLPAVRAAQPPQLHAADRQDPAAAAVRRDQAASAGLAMTGASPSRSCGTSALCSGFRRTAWRNAACSGCPTAPRRPDASGGDRRIAAAPELLQHGSARRLPLRACPRSRTPSARYRAPSSPLRMPPSIGCQTSGRLPCLLRSAAAVRVVHDGAARAAEARAPCP